MKTRKGQRGMTMIELMIALTVLMVGLAALMALIATAIATNNRNKLDTGGTFAAQAILETIAAQPAGTQVSMTDCAGNAITVYTAGAAGPNGAGAALASNGSIDFANQAQSSVPSGYGANFVGCGTADSQVIYDVRWNVLTIASGTGYNESLITVGAAQTAVAKNKSQAGGARFALPVTLRTISATGN
jgi:Tfp pilus assembly protein PilV